MAEIFEVKSKNGSTLMKYKLYDGLRMSLRVENVMERFEKLKTLKYKEGDVVIVTYPKTGMLFAITLDTHLSRMECPIPINCASLFPI